MIVSGHTTTLLRKIPDEGDMLIGEPAANPQFGRVEARSTPPCPNGGVQQCPGCPLRRAFPMVAGIMIPESLEINNLSDISFILFHLPDFQKSGYLQSFNALLHTSRSMA